ncbi:MAG: hypothetical protein EOO62_00770 [Hymenobacter sp.]|nr:MAG: hypothetical protein EOO62_00770 [Hymenobacter sp.]
MYSFLVSLMRIALLIGVGFWLSVVTAHAQATRFAEPRLYFGLQASYMRYPGLGYFAGGFPPFKAIYPAAATLGYRIKPRFSLEAGFTGRFPATQRADSANTGFEYSRYAYAVSVIGRGMLLRPARATPWAAELTGGLVFLNSEQQIISYYQTGGSRTVAGSSLVGIHDVQLALGLGTRYRLNEHWQLTGDVQGQLSVLTSIINDIFGTQSQLIGGGAAVGIRYAL